MTFNNTPKTAGQHDNKLNKLKEATVQEDGKLNRLLAEILEKRLESEDQYEIAAILESFGWNDERAASEFGVSDVFELAVDLWNIAEKNIKAQPFKPAHKPGRFTYILTVLPLIIRSFWRGTIFALPMAISVISMFTLRFSLWSYEYLSLEMATAIAIGTIMSFLAVGGFMQAIARRGFMYVKQGYYTIARRIIFYFVKIGYLVCLVTVVCCSLLNFFFGVFPLDMMLLIVLFFFFLSAIWLSVTVLYILEKDLTFAGLLVAGILLVFVFFRVLKWNILFSQMLALLLVTIAGTFITVFYFRQAEITREKGILPSLPRASITVYTVLPYFSYGFLYFFFLFADRVIAWSAGSTYMPYLIWFRGPYELGLDLALLALILPMGFIEVVINEFMLNLEAHLHDYSGFQTRSLAERYWNMYKRRFILVCVFSLASAFSIYLLTRYLCAGNLLPDSYNLLKNWITHFVFIVSLVSYGLLGAGLLNALLLFSLSQPAKVSSSILFALIANLVTGFVLSRWIDHFYAVIGLLLGTLVFLVYTCMWVREVLGRLDYYLYASS